MNPVLYDLLHLGRCGAVSRTVARSIARTGLPWSDLAARAVLGKPRKGAVEVEVLRDGLKYALDLRELTHRLMFLSLFENELRARAMRLVPRGGRVIDVGANVGWWTLPAALAAGPTGLVIAVEPNPWAKGRLERNLDLNRPSARLAEVKIVAAAAGSAPGEAILSARDLATEASQASLHTSKATGVPLESITVPVVQLSSLATGPIDLLKIDVEGHELAVLDGAAELFHKDPPAAVVLEIHAGTLARAGKSAPELVDRMEQLGYAPDDPQGRGTPEIRAASRDPRFFETILWTRRKPV